MDIDLSFRVARQGFFLAIPKAKLRCFQLARKTGLDIRLDTSKKEWFTIHISLNGKRRKVHFVERAREVLELAKKYFEFLS